MNSIGGAPYTFEFINGYNSAVAPSTVHVHNTALACFFKRYLLQEAQSVFKWTLPEGWNKNYFLNVLYVVGYIGVLDTPQFGVIPQHGGLGGYNVFYQPAWMIINNPLFHKSYRLTIGKECEVIKLEPDYCGLYDIIDYYGDLMALTAEAAGVNVLNTKMAYIFAAQNKAAAEALKKMYDNIASGEPAQFLDKSLYNDEGNLSVQLLTQNVGQNFIADKLIDTLRNVRNMFLTDIGIPNINLAKQSGVTDSEVNANNAEVKSKCALWLEELKECIDRVKKMFGIELSVDWRNKGVKMYDSINSDGL